MDFWGLNPIFALSPLFTGCFPFHLEFFPLLFSGLKKKKKEEEEEESADLVPKFRL